ncbi:MULTISPECIES: hypothetical protein [Deinococcus]|uniref:Uncharacterized protein n=1 Tax=Deinococcus rufus TaxID=2136097 RepID=A0ABV7Z8Q2_9DEIO|nr:hypothetical protein [Deinococcus sp. AB2017081]WQE94670.1 hypothetical protein U2P90_14840 [Deinococcus sp. AB2017081]
MWESALGEARRHLRQGAGRGLVDAPVEGGYDPQDTAIVRAARWHALVGRSPDVRQLYRMPSIPKYAVMPVRRRGAGHITVAEILQAALLPVTAGDLQCVSDSGAGRPIEVGQVVYVRAVVRPDMDLVTLHVPGGRVSGSLPSRRWS